MKKQVFVLILVLLIGLTFVNGFSFKKDNLNEVTGNSVKGVFTDFFFVIKSIFTKEPVAYPAPTPDVLPVPQNLVLNEQAEGVRLIWDNVLWGASSIPVNDCWDNDGDDYGIGDICLGPDCDDTNFNINPGVDEICDDEVDNDCDWDIDCDDSDCDSATNCQFSYPLTGGFIGSLFSKKPVGGAGGGLLTEGYNVYRSDGVDSTYEQIASGPLSDFLCKEQCLYIDDDISEPGIYFYIVSYFKGEEESDFSNEVYTVIHSPQYIVEIDSDSFFGTAPLIFEFKGMVIPHYFELPTDLTYKWKVESEILYGQVLSYFFEEAGSYPILLEVDSESEGFIGFDEVLINVYGFMAVLPVCDCSFTSPCPENYWCDTSIACDPTINGFEPGTGGVCVSELENETYSTEFYWTNETSPGSQTTPQGPGGSGGGGSSGSGGGATYLGAGLPSCTESWDCTSWQPDPCSQEETQTRTCTDLNDCGTEVNKPSESRICPVPGSEGIEDVNGKSKRDYWWLYLILVIILLILIGILLYFFTIKPKNNFKGLKKKHSPLYNSNEAKTILKKFVKNASSKGYNKKQIKNFLKKYKLKKEHLKDALSSIK